jgi:putative AbiEii toxin of type IV toxin-antitoxin system/AAA domain-containing protein
MHVKRVEIKNIRGFGAGDRGVSLGLERPDGSLAGWTVLAGRNGAGKTTFLRAVALALVGRRVARTLQESFAGWVHYEATQGRVTALGRHVVAPSLFEKAWRTSAASFVTEVHWARSQEASEPRVGGHITWTKKLTPPQGPWADEPRGWFVAGYGPFRRLSGHASDAQRLMAAPGHISRLASLFREDASLVECVAWLKTVYLRRLEKKPGAAKLEASMLRLLDDGLLPDGMRVEKIDSDGLWVTQGKVTLPLHELSDGYRTMAALVLDIARQLHDCFGELPIVEREGALAVDLPGVVLIDEVDAHLHVSWQQRVGFWLKRRFPKIQFLVTTHSPYVCQAADPRGLIRLPGPGEDRVAEHVSEDLFKKVVNGTADEAALSDLFGLERTVSDEAEKKRRELAELEAKIILDEASTKERRRHAQLQDELKLSPSGEVAVALQSVADAIGLPAAPKRPPARATARKAPLARPPKRSTAHLDASPAPAKARARARSR